MFRTLLRSLKSRPPANDASRPSGRLQVEALEDRSVPAIIADPVGDILSSYAGGVLSGMDVIAHEVVLLEDRVVFHGKMAGSVSDTQSVGALYLFGVDRGLGTARFLSTPGPVIGPHVTWDSIVRVNPDGTGLFNNVIAGVITPLSRSAITINGDEFTASVPLSVMTPAATRPPDEWTYNLWPRNGIGNNAQVSDLAPDDGNAPFQVIAPARTSGVAVNDGSAQRSMVNSLTVSFDGSVTIGPGAFQLARADGSTVELSVATSTVSSSTVAVLTFAGPDVIGGSLADGSYTLTIRGDLIQDRFGRALDGDGDGTAGGDRVDGFHRSFGDADGDGDVDRLDRDLFRSVFKKSTVETGYLWYLDFDADGDVDGRDNGQFNRRFGQN